MTTKKIQWWHLVLIGILIVFIVGSLMYKYIAFQSWSVNYINMRDSFDVNADQLFYSVEFEEGPGSITLYKTENGLLYLGYWEGDFPNHNQKSYEAFSLEDIFNRKSSDHRSLKPWQFFYKDQDIYYNLYLNPTTDTLKVNGEEVQVEKIPIELEGKSYTLGFWYKLFPKDTVVTVE